MHVHIAADPFPQLLKTASDALGVDALGDAAAALHQAGQLQPTNADVFAALARVHLKRCALQAHDEAIGRAIALAPHSGALRLRAALACPPMMTTVRAIAQLRARVMERLDWLTAAPLHLDDPLNELPTLSYYFAYHGLDDRPINRRLFSMLPSSSPLLRGQAPHIGRSRIPGPLRVGIFSPHLRDHTIGHLFGELSVRLDRRRFHSTLIFAESGVDEFALALAHRADAVALIPRDLGQARQRIAALGLDVLLYLDIGMDSLSSYLACSRLAPLQATTWGHPNSTGIATVDAFFSLTDLEPEGDSAYTERLYTQSTPNIWYSPPSVAERPVRARLGLPAGRLYACPQTLFKLHPDFDPVLVGILDRDPRGTLLLHAGRTRAWKGILLRRLEALRPGSSARIHWMSSMPRSQYIATLAACDVMLDPFPFGGGNTTLEALAVGTPVVTCPPRLARGRLAYAFCRQADWMDGVADDPADYVARAVRLASDPAARAIVQRRSAVLFDNPAGVRQFERNIERAWADSCADDA